MASTARFGGLLVLVVVAIFVDQATGLKCYRCESLKDERCGTTFNYKKSEIPDTYKVECKGANSYCKKIVSRDGPEGEQFVIRDCYDAPGNDTTPEGFLACHDLMKVGDLCYCNKDNCNGQGHIAASGLLAVVAVIAASVSRWQ